MDAVVVPEPRARRFPLKGRGGEMAALEFGPDDRPIDILFSHANGFNARTYRTILARPARDLRILAVDLRGHGASALPTPTEGRVGWFDFRDDLLALLDLLDAPPLTLAGHSMGATSSLLAAAEAPERVAAMVLFDPVIMPDGAQAPDAEALKSSPMVQGALRRRASFPSAQAAFQGYQGRGAFKTWTDAQLADYLAAGLVPAPDGGVGLACSPEWEASNFASHGHDPWDAFARSRCPIRIFRAEVGSTCRVDGRLDELTAGGRIQVETVAGSTHFLPMERPDVVEAALRGAVARAGAA